jgi:ABC-2 type transport system ATP-binding protein
MIEVLNLTQAFGKKTVLNQVSLSVKENEVCALVGRNGAGKSTFISSLLGLLPVKTGGTIKINGKERSKKQPWRNEIAYLPEKFMLYPSLTGYENMLFFAKASKGMLDEAKMKEILTSVRLWEDKDAPIKGYSKGMLQRLGLAITLYQDSDTIILDEPTSGIDPIGRNEILEILKGLTNKTILLSSHHLDEIRQLCTHVAYLDDGKITKYPVEEFVQLQHLGGR